MKSKTKNRLSEEKIRELVQIHFGQDCMTRVITELKGGMFNAIHRIERIVLLHDTGADDGAGTGGAGV